MSITRVGFALRVRRLREGERGGGKEGYPENIMLKRTKKTPRRLARPGATRRERVYPAPEKARCVAKRMK